MMLPTPSSEKDDLAKIESIQIRNGILVACGQFQSAIGRQFLLYQCDAVSGQLTGFGGDGVLIVSQSVTTAVSTQTFPPEPSL